jgi:hypothetical protein
MPEVPRIVQAALVAASIAMFVGSIVAIPWFVRRLPADHFVRPPKTHSLMTKVLRNAGGAVLVALGLAMLVLPGQGLIAILFGLSVMDLEVKHKVMRSLLGRKHIQELVQRIRAKAGKPPLVIPEHPVTG